jgi:hypothetical protein
MRRHELAAGQDERALLDLLPADGSPASNDQIQRRLGWDAARYVRARLHLEQEGYVLAGVGRPEIIHRNLTAVPAEFRPACGRPGARVIVRQVPVTVPHALCDLTGVIVSYPGHGGMTVPAPGRGTGNGQSMRVEVDARTRDVTVAVGGFDHPPRSRNPGTGLPDQS